jgi:hypothetical protein
MEYIELRHMVDNTILDPAVSDHIELRRCPCGLYSASSTYKAMFYGQVALLGNKELWRTS